MKKRSMLAIASLATGFVVAAVTPSHSAESAGASGTPTAGLPGTTGGEIKAAGLDVSGKNKLGGIGTTAPTKLGGIGTTAPTKLAGINVDRTLDSFGGAVNREADRAVNDAPHGKAGKKG